MESQRAWGGPNADHKAKISPIWDDFEQLRQDAFDWYGMDENFYNISFNVLGVESGVPRDIAQRDTSLEVWKRYGDQIEGTRHDVIYMSLMIGMNQDMRSSFHMELKTQETVTSALNEDSDGGSGIGPRRRQRRSSSSRPQEPRPEPKLRPKPEPKPRPKPQPKEPPKPKKLVRNNLNLPNPPPPVMFSEDLLSADEDEGLATETNEWTYPNVVNAGRKVKAYNRAMFHEEGRKVLIALHANQLDEPCGIYDEGLVPRDIARNLVTEWEILLRRTTIYLCAWADGIVSPKVLRKNILKANPDWVKLYRYIRLKCQANHLGVFFSPKTFALATFTGYEAIEQHRAKIQGKLRCLQQKPRIR